MFDFSEEQNFVPTLTLPEGMRVILGSGSPRRRELCTRMGLRFEVCVADCDESYDPAIPPVEAVELLAARKCRAVAAQYPADTLVIASDTMVELDGFALGKPRDPEDACRMLRSLSGRTHHVRTGLAVSWQGRMLTCADTSAVTFRPLGEEEIAAYVATGEPMDKAGSYAIQAGGGTFVTRVAGMRDTVVGLCCTKVKELVERLLGAGNDAE